MPGYTGPMTNPAKRLHAILLRTTSLGIHPKVESLKAWAQVLDSKSETLEHVLPLFQEVCKLPAAIQLEFEKNGDDDCAPYFRHFDRLRQFLSVQSLVGPWQNRTQLVTENILDSLEYAGMALEKFPSEKVIDDSDLEMLAKQIGELLEAITESKIDTPFKMFMVRSLSSLSFSLSQYRILGAEALAHATYPIVGEIVVATADIFVDESENEELGRLWKLLHSFNTLASAASNAKLLMPPSVTQFLLAAAGTS